ncbi:acetyl-CoA synthetase-like protein [Rhizodiscina lignyota]|uniref:Acetyl-CoA synthetase-like protein n=1 Tax=Rhizodiscina lignyota TaxID=1504668 RepID=A0A9P4IDM3_9PEZI|nr:acetyl-CoA synthetase-like protein [Rhizodiscina lignyota]
MSVSITSVESVAKLDVSATLKPSKRKDINCINDLIIHKAETIPDTVLIAYPASDRENGSLAEYTAKELDLFADAAATRLTSMGLVPRQKRSDKSEVVGLLGPSNLDYFIALLALTRMGFAVLFLSTRLPIEAYVSLLEKSSCANIVASDKFSKTIQSIEEVYSVRRFPLLDRSIYAVMSETELRFQRRVELINEENCIAFIVHSSGSTGLPKPIFQTHRSCLSNYALGSGFRALVTLPLFHNHGIATTFRGIVANKRTVFYNANLPLTNSNLVEAMKAAEPESFHCVPYALKVLAESDEGVAALTKCKLVLFGGSSLPDELGDLLVSAGVYVVGHYGATEMGQLMTSFRDSEDKAWNYMRPLPKVVPYLRFLPVSDGVFECVVLDGLPTKILSNSDDPPNSFHTRDTFEAHPTIPNAWKYLGRLDDRVTLVNGEKVLPVPYEHQIRQNDLVQDCLVFGVGKAFPGILVIPSEKGRDTSKEVLLERLKPSIEAANTRTEKFGQIPMEMVEILQHDIDYPRTDKGTMIRAASYKHFAELIEEVYVRFETPEDADAQRKLDSADLEAYLMDLFTNRVGVAGLSLDKDFFEAGTDSRQAIAARGHIMREIYLAGRTLGQNVVFEHPSIRALAKHLYSISIGSMRDRKDDVEVMWELIEKYSSFPRFVPGNEIPQGDVVLLTGATGSLGAHLLSQLLALPNVMAVYCLVRAESTAAAQDRITQSLAARRLPSLSAPEKVKALPSDLSKPDLGLDETTLTTLKRTLTSVIHSAWAVNFNIGVASFEPHHIRGTYNLLRVCQSVPFHRPARFSFISSISAAAGTPVPASIKEAYIQNPGHAQNMGYARSKFVAEHIVRAAGRSTGQDTRVLRTGQLIGDTINGLWNDTEAIPLMIRSAVTIRALPRLDEMPSWLPVDKCAEATLDLSGLRIPFVDAGVLSGIDLVYHLQNPRLFSWSDDLLPALKEAGLEFETVSQREWIQRLREGEPDPEKNPTIKLLEFFVEKYDNDMPGRKGLVFETSKTGERTGVIRDGVDVVGSGLIKKCVSEWAKCWMK